MKTKARSDRRTSMSIAITSRTVRQLHGGATPQLPCKIACSPTVAELH